jgi:hypothetical protein
MMWIDTCQTVYPGAAEKTKQNCFGLILAVVGSKNHPLLRQRPFFKNAIVAGAGLEPATFGL